MDKEAKLAKLDQLLEAYKQTTAKPCIAVKIEEGEPQVTDNKIGGKPYIPVGEEYPKDANGAPLALLLQVNLADFELPDWPRTGILEIFTDPAVDYPCRYAVKYYPDDQEYQTDLPVVDTSSYISPNGRKISFEQATSYLSPNDYRFDDTICAICSQVFGQPFANVGAIMDFFEGDEKWRDQIMQLNSNTPGIAIGGYQDFTQFDPRSQNAQMINMTESLFKLDSVSSDEEFMIGDAGILFTFISLEDLRAGKFENAVVDWDCC